MAETTTETTYLIDDIKEGITTLETTIKTNIKDNSQQEITGQKLQDVLVAIKDNIGDVTDLPVLNDQMYLAIGTTNKTFVAHPRYTDDNGRARLRITTKTYKNNLTISFKGKGDYAAVSKTITMCSTIGSSIHY